VGVARAIFGGGGYPVGNGDSAASGNLWPPRIDARC